MLPRRIAAMAAGALGGALLSSCITVAAPEERPLDTFPAGADMALTRSDLLATARATFRASMLDQALASRGYLIVKRFAGMAPPPPPGSGPGYRPPTPAALLRRDGSGWLSAGANGWRRVAPEQSGRIDAILASAEFRAAAAYTPACPDFGSSQLIAKLPDARETVRNAQCSGPAASVVELALAS